jgi:predicted dehydrogenase
MTEVAEDSPGVLVVGTGFGCRIQVPALRAAGFRVLGLVGTDIGRTRLRATTNGVEGAFTDLDEAIARTGATAVAVSTPRILTRHSFSRLFPTVATCSAKSHSR